MNACHFALTNSTVGCMAAADFIDRVIDELASVEMAEGLWDTMLNRDEGFLHTLSTAFEPYVPKRISY